MLLARELTERVIGLAVEVALARTLNFPSRAFPLTEVEQMISNGGIKDATTVAIFGLLRLKGLL
jgi:hypothetical protein